MFNTTAQKILDVLLLLYTEQKTEQVVQGEESSKLANNS